MRAGRSWLQPSPPPTVTQDLHHQPADLPRIVWLELTSRCPLACDFCTRLRLKGTGRHMAPELMRSILDQLEGLERIYLNHSGESINYPHLAEAIQRAKRTGAKTEMVSTLVSAPRGAIQAMLESGLDHLRVSVHTMDAEAFPAIYGFGSVERMKANIGAFLELREKLKATTTLEFSFVASLRNVGHLEGVAAYAESIGVPVISVLSVTVRDGYPLGYEEEVQGILLRPAFRRRLHDAIAEAHQGHPGVQLQAVSPDIGGNEHLDAAPRFFPGALPPGARIATCFENPWDTLHILAGGEVMACGEHRRQPFGNLSNQRLHDVWHGAAFEDYRRDFAAGADALCAACPCKVAYVPAPLLCGVSASCDSPQFLRGWYDREATGVRWTRKEAVLALARPPRGNLLRLEGILPPPVPGERANEFRVGIEAAATRLATLENPSSQAMPFELRIPLPRRLGNPLYLRLTTTSTFCPHARGEARDVRQLGMALIAAEICDR